MPWTSTKTISACLSVRLHEDKLDLAKTPRLEDGTDVGFESFGNKLPGVVVVVEESVSVTLTHCALTSKIGVTGNKLRSVGTVARTQ